MNSCVALIILTSLFAKIVVIICILRKREEIEDFNLKYGTLVEGFSGKGFFGVYWIPIILVRWTLVTIIMVFMTGSYCFQIMFCLVMSVMTQVFIIAGKPYDSR